MQIKDGEDLADLMRSEKSVDWRLLKKEMPWMSTEELMGVMLELGLYVNKEIALEIAGREDAVFCLRKVIQDGHNWYQSGPGESWAPIHAIHILGQIGTPEALELILDTLRYRSYDLSDTLTEDVPRLLVAFGENGIKKLMEFTEDETIEAFARGTATTALKMLARKYLGRAEDIKGHLLNLLNTTLDETFAAIVADDLAFFHDPSVLPEIHRAYEEERIDTLFMELEEIEDVIGGRYKNLDEEEYRRHTADPLKHFTRENIEHIHSLFYAKAAPKKGGVKRKKIGRNDPCPCGSGKKYKKCCMKKDVLREEAPEPGSEITLEDLFDVKSTEINDEEMKG